MDHYFTHSNTPAPVAASLTLFGVAVKLWPNHGLDPATLAALFGGIGTLLMGVVNFSREVRTWLDRREAKAR